MAVEGRNIYGGSFLNMYSHSCLFAEPGGACVLISSVPLYSAAIARPDGNFVTFVREMPIFAIIAVSRLDDRMLWCVSYPRNSFLLGRLPLMRREYQCNTRSRNFFLLMLCHYCVVNLIVPIFPR